EFYLHPFMRKLKWNGYINRQRSEDKMINQIKKHFGDPEDTVIAIGDWSSNGHHMRGKEPTKGKGMRTIFKKAGYRIFLVNEYRTSERCYNCHEKMDYCMRRPSKKPKKLGQNEE